MERQFAATAAKDLEYAKAFKPAAAFNPTLVAHAFLEQLREDIGEDDFREVSASRRRRPSRASATPTTTATPT